MEEWQSLKFRTNKKSRTMITGSEKSDRVFASNKQKKKPPSSKWQEPSLYKKQNNNRQNKKKSGPVLQLRKAKIQKKIIAVSYTHLTLPTNREV